ncbi:MAG: hypothetical protein HY551_06760 [Elusimicrobia bacterium]|nr:hypothetical protein [Elusimicrobiota bacterium]
MPGLQVYVDYPSEDEHIASNLYTFRIGTAPPAVRVEISVDGEPWQACRAGSGYWWFDWIGFEIGEHSLKARAQGQDGATAQSKPRRFRRVAG